MKVTAGVVTKAAVGTGIAGVGGLGIYLTADRNNNLISKYEVAMINFLNANDENDIVFEVKKGSDASQELGENDISLSGDGSQEVSVSATVQVTAGKSTSFKKGTSAAGDNDPGMKEIKEVNKGNWTWKCSFKFTKGSGIAENNLEIKDKERIFGTGNKGLFGILKKDLSGYTNSQSGEKKWTKQDLKKVKESFIRNCGYARTTAENKKINGEAESSEAKTVPSQVKDFVFDQKGSDNKLSCGDTSHFNHWFREEYANNTYGS